MTWAFFLCSVENKRVSLIKSIALLVYTCAESRASALDCNTFSPHPSCSSTPQVFWQIQNHRWDPKSFPNTWWNQEPWTQGQRHHTQPESHTLYGLHLYPEPLFWIPNQSANNPVAAQSPRGSDTSRITGGTGSTVPQSFISKCDQERAGFPAMFSLLKSQAHRPTGGTRDGMTN